MNFVKVPVSFKGLDLCVIYFKETKRGGKWQAIITTDKKLSAQRAYKWCQTRWAIETSFKELKQQIGYGKSMSRDFDARISDAAQCLICYNIRSHLKAIENHESIGQIFEEVSQSWLKPTIMKRFWEEFYRTIKELAELIAKFVEELVQLVISKSNFIKNVRNIGLILGAET
ncbi:MAG: transposase [Bacteroidetes bacterium]|nr:transposase [Bacteroidota bacterium]